MIVLKQLYCMRHIFDVYASLHVPDNKIDDMWTVLNYFISYGLHPTWIRLAGILYCLDEKRALTVVRRFLHTPSPGKI